MPSIRLLFLWHMHQPYYKDLVTGEYRMPWVRLHALKDYYGMVKLLDEFPGIHQTFNLVPCLIDQIQDYVSGAARDPFFDVAARPASQLDFGERVLALQYLFQANTNNLIGRYPRYRELWQEFKARPQDMAQLVPRLSNDALTDLQVLSQVAWMDEFFLDDPEIRELVKKGRGFSLDDQQVMVRKQKEFLATVLPAYAQAQKRGAIEISTSPYYHPILPLVCDTDAGAVAHSGLPLPARRFRHPEDAHEQVLRGLALHERVFGTRPRGMWPSEGSVSDAALSIAHAAGIKWVASDEGVLGRSIGTSFQRNGSGRLDPASAEKLYQIYRWERDEASVNIVFRDHSLSDLIGFVYSGIPAHEAAEDFIRRVKESAEPVLLNGQDAVVSIILDGENAWESFPQSGREFLRRMYDGIQKDPMFQALTVSEAVESCPAPQPLKSIFPGSWINANFDVWIGAPEDNLAWDHLSAARDFYEERAGKVPAPQRELAHEELLIAEGSDWNWWYGPEHHSDNDRDFDDLYRKHLSNVYHALGAAAPDALSLPIGARRSHATFSPQTAYIHPRLEGKTIGYFDWLGAATHVADRQTSAMHGKVFLLDTGYAGVDENNLYCRVDFMEPAAEWSTEGTQLAVTIEVRPPDVDIPRLSFRLEADIAGGQARDWRFGESGHGEREVPGVLIRMKSVFECQIPLPLLSDLHGTVLAVRFSLWRDRLPLDALPQEGAIEVRVVPAVELGSEPYAKP